nr:hypothetical protein GCM10025699_06510 [Microbacterium flavescens]
MRQQESGILAAEVAVGDEIEIERAVAPALAALTAVALLDRMQIGEQHRGRQPGGDERHRVEICGGRGIRPVRLDRHRLDGLRRAHGVDQRQAAQRVDRGRHRGGAIAEVRTECHHGVDRGAIGRCRLALESLGQPAAHRGPACARS